VVCGGSVGFGRRSNRPCHESARSRPILGERREQSPARRHTVNLIYPTPGVCCDTPGVLVCAEGRSDVFAGAGPLAGSAGSFFGACIPPGAVSGERVLSRRWRAPACFQTAARAAPRPEAGTWSCQPGPERFSDTFFVPVSPSLPLPAGFKHLCRLRPTSRPVSGEQLAGALTSDKHYPSQTVGSFYHNIRLSLMRSQCRLLPFFSLIG
jgi:hypothetical protein